MVVIKTCAKCGKDVALNPSRIKKSKSKKIFCSKICANTFRSKKIIKKCDNCGKLVYKNSSRLKKQKNIFCSNRCNGIFKKSKHISKKCNTCGKSVVRMPYLLKNKNNVFCSPKCCGASNCISITKKCNACGKEVTRIPSLFKNKNTACSSKCSIGKHHPQFNNWISREPYGKDWSPELKKQIAERDNYICQHCGKPAPNGCPHHISYIKTDCRPENLVWVHIGCNTKFNSNRSYWFAYWCEKLNIEEDFLVNTPSQY